MLDSSRFVPLSALQNSFVSEKLLINVRKLEKTHQKPAWPFGVYTSDSLTITAKGQG